MSPFATAPRPIRRVLVANRGEIACRIIRTCDRLGIETVAVYSDADAGALHVRSATDAVRIGPPAAAESYLNIDAIIAAARQSGADAIHPGYGFLSENAAFARACDAAGIVFIGPSADAIARMGSKIEAKKIAEATRVPTVPGYHGSDQSLSALAREARKIGFPVLIKASAGGGGRGMRRVDAEGELAEALRSSQAEAKAAFGNDAVLIEKLIPNPRHLEVQLVGDAHGNLVHLFERDCSIQRNNQKVFEEAPAPKLPDAVREKLYDRALKLGRAINYTSAGTIEFVMAAGSQEPYFLEMNTRLQVEHPVTEAITGIDLVEWQMRVAAGLPLPATQADIRRSGHAIEARIAAERPELGYQPATGTILGLTVPKGVRFDSGIATGAEIGVHYDSMVAKLIAYGDTRATAVAKLGRALSETAIVGINTNIGMLAACVERPAFTAGRLTTDFIASEFPGGWIPPANRLQNVYVQAAMAWAGAQPVGGRSPWQARDGFRVMGQRRPAQVELLVRDGQEEIAITVLQTAEGLAARASANGAIIRRADVAAIVQGAAVALSHGGIERNLSVGLDIENTAATEGPSGDESVLSAPLPGIVTRLFVDPGARVQKGDNLIQIEAMKLVHTLKAPSDGLVGKIYHAIGDTVAAGAALVDIVLEERD